MPPLTAEKLNLRTTLRNDHLGISPHTPEQKESEFSEVLRPEVVVLKSGLHLFPSIVLRPWEKDEEKMTIVKLRIIIYGLLWPLFQAQNKEPFKKSNILS